MPWEEDGADQIPRGGGLVEDNIMDHGGEPVESGGEELGGGEDLGGAHDGEAVAAGERAEGGAAAVLLDPKQGWL